MKIHYLKENHSPSEVSDFQAAMNIAVAKAYDKGMKDGLEKQGEPTLKAEQSGMQSLNTWSEEDECYMNECIGAIATKDAWSFEEKRKTKEWVKSLKQRIGG